MRIRIGVDNNSYFLKQTQLNLRKLVENRTIEPSISELSQQHLILSMFLRRCFGLQLLLVLLTACGSAELSDHKKLSIGVVSYGDGRQSVEQFDALKTHLETELKSIVELEPAFNEVQAIQQIDHHSWDMVFAPPGLAAIAISQKQYLPLLSESGGEKERSVIVVRNESPIQKVNDLSNKIVALGHEGSATGYYLPIFNLYGLTLAEVRFAPTPKTLLAWVSDGSVAAGALSIAELEQYRGDFGKTQFRVLYRDVHPVPAGSVLVGPNIDRNAQQQILQALETAPPRVASSVGYVSNTKPPDYSYLIKVVNRVRPIAQRIKNKPAPLF
jgi:phosphonate transport system substrate-binding protein